MAPRVTFLIIVSIVIYISLSLYHWSQVKKMPSTEKLNSVHSVLARDSQEKNWVQISTSPNLPGENAKNIVTITPPVAEIVQAEELAASPIDSSTKISISTEDKTVDPVQQEQLTFHNENKELQNEKDINQRQSQKIRELQSQVLSLQAALDDASAQLQEKNKVEEALKEQHDVLNIQSDRTISSQDNQVKALKTSLASRLDALVKANERITGLADQLKQNKLTLIEAKNTNNHLQSALSETEIAKINARQETDNLREELIRTKEDKEKYLAETGRLYKQLKQKSTRLARVENELNRSQLKAEAMFRYGQEQENFVTPFMQQIKVLNAKMEDKEADLIEADEQISLLKSQEKIFEDKIQTLEQDVEKKEALDQELLKKSQTLIDAQKHSEELALQLKVLADQLNARNVIVNKLNQDVSLANTNAQSVVKQAQQELTSTKQQLEVSIARQNETENKLNEANAENQQLTVKIEEQHKLQATTKSESEQITAQLNQKNQLLAEVNKTLQNTQATLMELETANNKITEKNNSEANKTIKQLQNSLNISQASLTETVAENKKLQESLTNTKRKEADDTQTTKLLQLQIDQLNKAAAVNDKQQKTMAQTLSDMKQENNQLQEKIIAAEQKSASATSLASALELKTSELDQEKEHISTLTNKVADLQSDLERREDAFFTMQEEFTSLQEKYDSLQKERDVLFPYTLDNDNDTISDAKDTCPGTVSGAEVGQDGCELDKDGDKIVDRLDLCPDTLDQSEINPFGCSEGAPIVLSGIYFSGGNTDLSPASRSYLEKVVAILDLFKDIRFEVAGHTDNIGETDRNLTVSKKRAEAVSNYLIEAGIEADRIVTVGHGPDNPVTDNTTIEGRAANRRVELKIIPPNAPSTTVDTE